MEIIIISFFWNIKIKTNGHEYVCLTKDQEILVELHYYILQLGLTVNKINGSTNLFFTSRPAAGRPEKAYRSVVYLHHYTLEAARYEQPCPRDQDDSRGKAWRRSYLCSELDTRRGQPILGEESAVRLPLPPHSMRIH